MRVATNTLIDLGVNNMLNQQSALARISSQISGGQRMQTAADDPAGWSQAMSLDQVVADIGRYKTNVNTTRQRLSLEEGALAGSSDVLARARELAIQSNSAILDASSRQAITAELTQLKDQLLSYANSQDANGSYLFAGSKSSSSPFSHGNGSVVYNGDQNQRLMAIGPGRNIADGDSGASVFLANQSGNGTFVVSAPPTNTGTAQLSSSTVLDASLWDRGSYAITFNGSNYSVTDSLSNVVASGTYSSGNGIRFRGIEVSVSGQPATGDQLNVGPSVQKDVFAMLNDLIGIVQSPGSTGAQRSQFQTAMQTVQLELATAFDQVNNIRSTVGSRLSALDEAENSLSQQSLTAESTLSNVRDLDLAQASAQLNLHSLMLQAAQLAFTKVQGLSLFQYLK